MHRTLGRKILFLIDNCSAHGTLDNMPKNENIEVHFLPPNGTSRIQPLDGGIIAFVEAAYRTRIFHPILDNMDTGAKSIYNVDILTAMKWVKSCWEATSSSKIKQCWDNCFKSDDGVPSINPCRSIQTALAADVRTQLNGQNFPFNRVALESLLNPEEEDECLDDFSVNNLLEEIFNPGLDDVFDEEEVEVDENRFFSVSEQLKGLSVAIQTFEKNDVLNKDIKKHFFSLQRDLRIQRQSEMKQTDIRSFFS